MFLFSVTYFWTMFLWGNADKINYSLPSSKIPAKVMPSFPIYKSLIYNSALLISTVFSHIQTRNKICIVSNINIPSIPILELIYSI